MLHLSQRRSKKRVTLTQDVYIMRQTKMMEWMENVEKAISRIMADKVAVCFFSSSLTRQLNKLERFFRQDFYYLVLYL